MTLSIIIPTFNEEEHIGELVSYLLSHGNGYVSEIIVSDAGSTDLTIERAHAAGAIVVSSIQKGRAAQMNFGASFAQADLLYFVHADTRPPSTYPDDIIRAAGRGADLGRYLSAYDSSHLLLKINALLSKLDTFAGMGGDQTLFITRTLFERTGGFDSSMKIMEEFEFCARARKAGRYSIIHKPVLISARKYVHNGWLSVQRANFMIMRMYQKGATQQQLVDKYRGYLNSPVPRN